MIEPAIEKACKAEVIFTQDEINRRKYDLHEKYQRDRIAEIDYAVNQERKKYLQEEENRVIRWIKKGKSFDDIMDFTFLPQERVQQLFEVNNLN